ncbi:MAG: endonuclease III domain-containing protein [Proteobacteria bacterium]|nr:endonuclease III domain-containing protein [Pseudomonadota bacterium]MBU1688496.1 endonuclease III domain-containing protein [Pseudomonadota bacterium]
MAHKISEIYQILFNHYGPQHWWPGDTPLEIMIGAVLTQNTNWQNVEKAIDNLKAANLLSLIDLAEIAPGHLAELIRPSGYYNLKAGRLKNLVTAITDQSETLDDFFAVDRETLRDRLLAIKGIGPETADSIILYAAEKPIFVVDAYTHRILLRHDLIWDDADYNEIQSLFTDQLEEETPLFNEYHALLVQVGKDFCRKTNPRCDSCPLLGV